MRFIVGFLRVSYYISLFLLHRKTQKFITKNSEVLTHFVDTAMGSHDHVAYVQHQTYVLNLSIKKLEENNKTNRQQKVDQ